MTNEMMVTILETMENDVELTKAIVKTEDGAVMYDLLTGAGVPVTYAQAEELAECVARQHHQDSDELNEDELDAVSGGFCLNCMPVFGPIMISVLADQARRMVDFYSNRFAKR